MLDQCIRLCSIHCKDPKVCIHFKSYFLLVNMPKTLNGNLKLRVLDNEGAKYGLTVPCCKLYVLQNDRHRERGSC